MHFTFSFTLVCMIHNTISCLKKGISYSMMCILHHIFDFHTDVFKLAKILYWISTTIFKLLTENWPLSFFTCHKSYTILHHLWPYLLLEFLHKETHQLHFLYFCKGFYMHTISTMANLSSAESILETIYFNSCIYNSKHNV